MTSGDYLIKAAEQIDAAAANAKKLSGDKAAAAQLEVAKAYADLAALSSAIDSGKVSVTLGHVAPAGAATPGVASSSTPAAY